MISMEFKMMSSQCISPETENVIFFRVLANGINSAAKDQWKHSPEISISHGLDNNSRSQVNVLINILKHLYYVSLL